MRSIVLLLLLYFFINSLAAQKHDYNWVMGYEDFVNPDPGWGGLIMDFNTVPPSFNKVTTHLNMSKLSISCSDSSGNLLFYSNGVRIHSKNHSLMENGDTLNPGNAWEKSKMWGFGNGYGALVLPAPGRHNYYYLFHLGLIINSKFVGSSPLYYSLIDMNVNGGLGKVVQKNVILLNDTLINPVAVKHGNGRDWWLILGKSTTSVQYTYLVTPNGIEGPFVQEFGPVFNLYNEGPLCYISPDGGTYIRSQMFDGIRIYDFNRCTGQMGNLRFIPKSDNLTGGIFSPDSRMTYFNNHRYIIQVDLPALDPGAYRDTLAHFDGLGSTGPPFYTYLGWAQLGPDGKIYMNTLTTTFKLHVIHRPELPGVAADIQLNGIDLPRLNDATCFNFPNYRLGEWEDSPCDTVHLQQTGDGFVRTWYDPARWQPETQEQQRLIQLFSDENQIISGEEWNQDTLLMTNPALFDIEKVPPKPAQVRQHSGETLIPKNGKRHE